MMRFAGADSMEQVVDEKEELGIPAPVV